ncbi:general secretion pathway protein [bacterium]|nr:secretin N-terminal domain-containing protein [Rubripirellula sp.]MDA7492808.1 general secretion pathway protein [bacterium]MDB4654425.1 general secretion pathway protein [Rubripirellula sp.]MDB4654437.1 general secretion pathway protein [Rubripirellula sp.]
MTTFWHFRIQQFQVYTFIALVTGLAVPLSLGQESEPVVPTQPAATPNADGTPQIPVEAGIEAAAPDDEDAGKALADLLGKAMADEDPGEVGSEPVATAKLPNDAVRFSFDGVAWRDVIRWLADEGGLALQVSELPTGSFTYSDPRVFTHAEAIDRINLFLLPEGFTLVRSGQLLSVINLADQRSMQQLDAMAELVTTDDLKDRNRHEVLKCIFPLGDIDPEEAVQELSVMNLMTTPEVLGKTKQLIITDTASKLRSVQSILSAFTPDEMTNGTVVESFALKHVLAEDVLLVARPHLGLATGEMIGIDVSISADVLGKNIFVTGMEDKVKLLEGLVKAVDQPEQKETNEEGESVLRSHAVSGGNVETVYNVLQTLLAGRTNTIRLSMDEDASTIVAFAPESVQKEIEGTVSQLQASEAEFAVIPLKTVDPYFVISLLDEMLDLPDSLDDPETIDPDAPKIDADPGSMRLFVRAKKAQLEQIKKIVEGLDSVQAADSGTRLRFLPLKGENADELLDAAVKFWQGNNEVIRYRSLGNAGAANLERIVNDPDEQKAKKERAESGQDQPSDNDERRESPDPSKVDASLSSTNSHVLTAAQDKSSAIRLQMTPRGLMLQSEDPAALDRFEEHLRSITGPLDSMPSPPVVFYLQYTKADDALRFLADLLDGGEAAMEGQAGSLVNGFLASPGSTLGSFLTTRDGVMTLTAGASMSVVADTRLNRLIAQGSASEVEQVEAYLKIIDRSSGLTDTKTYGQSHVIELANIKAVEMAAVIREAFAGRVIASTTGQSGQPGQQQPGQPRAPQKPDPREADSKPKKGAAPQKSTPARNLEPKMTIAVHEPSNSLVVTAPERLYQEVERLVKVIDVRGEQTIEVVAPANGLIYEALIQQVMLGEEGSSSRRPSSSSSSSSRTTSSSSSRSTKSSGR